MNTKHGLLSVVQRGKESRLKTFDQLPNAIVALLRLASLLMLNDRPVPLDFHAKEVESSACIIAFQLKSPVCLDC